MRYDEQYEGVDPLELSEKNYAMWRLGYLLYTHMHRVQLDPEDIRYLHRDKTENDTVILKELLHCFQREMTHSERSTFREHLTLLLPPRQ